MALGLAASGALAQASRHGPSLTPRTYGGSKQTGEQAAAIGRAGEELAYEWLRNKFGREATPDSWVSSNRTRLGGHDGNDGLGYDFRIERRRVRIFLALLLFPWVM